MRLNQLLALSLGVTGGYVLAAGNSITAPLRAIGAFGGDMTVTFKASAVWGGTTCTGVVIANGTTVVIGLDNVSSVAGSGRVVVYKD
jgi:hypothetical protein